MSQGRKPWSLLGCCGHWSVAQVETTSDLGPFELCKLHQDLSFLHLIKQMKLPRSLLTPKPSCWSWPKTRFIFCNFRALGTENSSAPEPGWWWELGALVAPQGLGSPGLAGKGAGSSFGLPQLPGFRFWAAPDIPKTNPGLDCPRSQDSGFGQPQVPELSQAQAEPLWVTAGSCWWCSLGEMDGLNTVRIFISTGNDSSLKY